MRTRSIAPGAARWPQLICAPSKAGPVGLEHGRERILVHALLQVPAGVAQLGHAGHLDQAQPAGAHIINAIQMAERRDPDASIRRGFQNGGAFVGADQFAVEAVRPRVIRALDRLLEAALRFLAQ